MGTSGAWRIGVTSIAGRSLSADPAIADKAEKKESRGKRAQRLAGEVPVVGTGCDVARTGHARRYTGAGGERQAGMMDEQRRDLISAEAGHPRRVNGYHWGGELTWTM